MTVRSDAPAYSHLLAAHDASFATSWPKVRYKPIPWWLWWNICSLDAPTVACVWALLLLRSSGFSERFPEVLALVVAVWFIYTVDRLLDGLARRGTSRLQTRHLFVAKHRLVFAPLAFLAGGALLWFGRKELETYTLRAGLALGVIVAFYLLSIHAAWARFARLLPKEIAVGVIFAAGTSIPLWCRPQGFSFHSVLVSVMFGMLCALNCLFIECWEHPRRGREWRRPPTPWIAWAQSHLKYISLALMTTAFLFSCFPDWRGPAGLPMLANSLAAFFILALNQKRRSLSPESLRVLADVALVLPALLALAFFYA